MARNKDEQLAYLMKRRHGGMSDSDYQDEIRRYGELCREQGYEEGREQEHVNWWRE